MPASPEASSRRPSAFMLFLRYGLPLLICASGIVLGFVRGWDETGIEAAVAMFAAGSSLWLMNFLWRVGVVGDRDRVDEDAARAYFDEHGRWPDEERRPSGR
jgi:hypothetical protein